MSFVLDADTCSFYLRGDRSIFNRFIQYAGGLHVSAVTVGELLTWAHRGGAPPARLPNIESMFAHLAFLPLDEQICDWYGRVRAQLLDRGVVIASPDLFIAATALRYDFTLVTHNTRHLSQVPSLRLMDWVTQ